MQFVYLVFKLDLRGSKDYDGNKADLPSRSFGATATIIYKQETLVTQEMRKVIQLKTQTIRRQSCRIYLRLNICRLYGGMMKFGGYWIGIAQIADEIKEKLNFRICPKSAISLLVSRTDMSDMRCFPIGGMKKQHDAILESFGWTEEITYSLTRLPPTTYSLLPSSLFDLKNLELASSPCFSQSSKLF